MDDKLVAGFGATSVGFYKGAAEVGASEVVPFASADTGLEARLDSVDMVLNVWVRDEAIIFKVRGVMPIHSHSMQFVRLMCCKSVLDTFAELSERAGVDQGVFAYVR